MRSVKQSEQMSFILLLLVFAVSYTVTNNQNVVKETIFPLPALPTCTTTARAVPGNEDVIVIYKRTDKPNTCNDIGCSNDGDTEEKTEKGRYGIDTVHYSITVEDMILSTRPWLK